jgi:hypothetical protein
MMVFLLALLLFPVQAHAQFLPGSEVPFSEVETGKSGPEVQISIIRYFVGATNTVAVNVSGQGFQPGPGNTCPRFPLTLTEDCVVAVVFAPTSSGEQTGRVVAHYGLCPVAACPDQIWALKGTGVAAPPPPPLPPPPPPLPPPLGTGRAPHDFNFDGHPDLLWQNDDTREAWIWYMGGPDGSAYSVGSARPVTDGPMPGWKIVVTSDFNLDGHPDLLWQNDDTREAWIWHMGGPDGSVYSVGSARPVTDKAMLGWKIVGAADFDFDGHPDLLWQNDDTREAWIWYMGGLDGSVYSGRARPVTDKPMPAWQIVK